MHLAHLLSVRRIRHERVLAQARELALLRLEQCIADFRIPAASNRNEIHPSVDSLAAKNHQPFHRSFKDPANSDCALTPVFNSCSAATATEEIIHSLRASAGRLMRVTFSDGVVQKVIVRAVDHAGFLHHGTECADPPVFWTRFEDVNALEAEN